MTLNTLKKVARALVEPVLVNEAMRAVMVVPMFWPIAIAAACTKPNPGIFMPNSISVTAIVADDDCTIIVITIPTSTNKTMVENASVLTCSNILATIPPKFMSVAPFDMNESPMKRNEKP